MSRFVVVACVVAAASGVLLADQSASAGRKDNFELTLIGNTVSGNLGAVRNSADGNELFGCTVEVFRGSAIGWCGAVFSDLTTRRCVTSDPTMIAVMSGMSNDAYLVFEFDDAGSCTYLRADAWSSPAVRIP